MNAAHSFSRRAALLWLAFSTVALADTAPRIAIIIDDLGYQIDAGLRAIELPGPVSYAVLPATPNGRVLALMAHQRGKEVLLHLPFESQDRENRDEPGAITLDMSRAAFHDAFASALESVPYAIGVSNHRGSLLTRHPGHMSWLMEEIAAHEGMFFVDSFTTPQSVAMQIAAERGIAAARRHVFLDNDRSAEAIARAFADLAARARRDGLAVGIGHPYPETLAYLETKLAELEAEQIVLIPVSEAVNYFEPDPRSVL
jgi:polysaccharide deacetylase 2 family uncharacterized protein YibQ